MHFLNENHPNYAQVTRTEKLLKNFAHHPGDTLQLQIRRAMNMAVKMVPQMSDIPIVFLVSNSTIFRSGWSAQISEHAVYPPAWSAQPNKRVDVYVIVKNLHNFHLRSYDETADDLGSILHELRHVHQWKTEQLCSTATRLARADTLSPFRETVEATPFIVSISVLLSPFTYWMFPVLMGLHFTAACILAFVRFGAKAVAQQNTMPIYMRSKLCTNMVK